MKGKGAEVQERMPHRQATILVDTTKVTTIEIVYIEPVIDATNAVDIKASNACWSYLTILRQCI